MAKGAPKGNQNAKGHGAPKGNRNAETHGANSKPDTSRFTNEEKDQIEAARLLNETLAHLTAKRIDLEKRMDDLEASPKDKYITSGMDTTTANGTSTTVYWESKDTRAEKLSAAYLRVLGRILKVSETLQKSSLERERLSLERDKLKLSREKAIGVFEIEEE